MPLAITTSGAVLGHAEEQVERQLGAVVQDRDPASGIERGDAAAGNQRGRRRSGRRAVRIARGRWSSRPATRADLRAGHDALPAQRHQPHVALDPGLEADRRAGWNIEPGTLRRAAVELERRVRVDEMEV
jgi:hypothetical protein